MGEGCAPREQSSNLVGGGGLSRGGVSRGRARVTGRPLTSRWRKCRQPQWELPAAPAAGLDALFLPCRGLNQYDYLFASGPETW